MYVCVAEKCEMMDFFRFFSTVVFIDNFPPSLGKKTKNDGFLCMYVCVKQNPSLMDFFKQKFLHLSLIDIDIF